ncbi:B3 domain-containing protein Os06g0112300 isoform X2 [Brachypodium distachyon]|uniref:TF-B3 domain-containing protein n=1 Tax=Brachypodium distachyon TaxID=15368 RepID=A0A0Q3JBP9_BRADI|nr:B3 domain-containing protein Os06g0112300 isoform X2 [Brachypodium distachyon]KQJ95744.1 hypothetical protein BRADI_3g18810v3 [Brachypodium distachyon]|eukprot:XP_010234507.1 B3 domain-containing protein Os06g0112300 isoform X2 [Brachypodium distachyon]
MTAASTETLHGGGDAATDAEEGPLSRELRQLPDQVLQERLQRMQGLVDVGFAARLPDGGKTYHHTLHAVRHELDRRRQQAAAASCSAPPPPPSPEHAPAPPTPHGPQGELPTDVDRCEQIVQPRCAESPEIHVPPSLPVHSAQMETPACPSKQLPDVHVIKTILEPCEDSPEPAPAPAPALYPAPDATEDWETTPLSGNHPFFTMLMSRSHVQKPFQLGIPSRFRYHLPEACKATTLICRGKSWPMSYRGDLKMKKLDVAWKDFAVDNRLQVNDACIFELVNGAGEEELVFQVQILRGGLPKEVVSKGATADEPMIIN